MVSREQRDFRYQVKGEIYGIKGKAMFTVLRERRDLQYQGKGKVTVPRGRQSLWYQGKGFTVSRERQSWMVSRERRDLRYKGKGEVYSIKEMRGLRYQEACGYDCSVCQKCIRISKTQRNLFQEIGYFKCSYWLESIAITFS